MTETARASPSERKIPFAELQARVGERLQLVVQRYSHGRAFASSLVGWIEGDFVIVRRPVDDSGPVPLVVGDNVSVRLFTGTDVAEFASTVQRMFGTGLPYCHLDYPTQVKAMTLRAELRVSVDLPAVVTIEGREGDLDVRVSDISTRGARLLAPSSPGGPGTRLSVRVAFTDGEADAPALAFAAEVRSVRALSPDQPEGPTVCGLKFGELGEDQQAFLQAMLRRTG